MQNNQIHSASSNHTTVDVFISHSSQDRKQATFFYEQLRSRGVRAFLAPTSVPVGAKWSAYILNSLRQSKMVLLLASSASIDSKYVNQEIGGAIAMSKPVFPVMLDVTPTRLPGWSSEYQADDRRATSNVINQITKRVESQRMWEAVAIVGLLALIGLALRSK